MIQLAKTYQDRISAHTPSCNAIIELLEHLCSHEANPPGTFAWLISWLAYPIQNPGAKMKTAVLMVGPKATGKTLFFDMIVSLYGSDARRFKPTDLESRFNDWVSGAMFATGDIEAHSATGATKAMWSTLAELSLHPFVRINRKCEPSWSEKNHCNFVALANDACPDLLRTIDPRIAVIMAPKPARPSLYRRVADEIKRGGNYVFLNALRTADLRGFATDTPPPTGRDLTKAQRHILRHSLGLTRGKREYRNHFVTGPGSKDHDDCMALTEMGLMTRRAGNELSGGDDVFTVTDAGKDAARAAHEGGE